MALLLSGGLDGCETGAGSHDIVKIHSNIDFDVVGDSVETTFEKYPIILPFNQIYFFDGKVIYIYQMPKNNFYSMEYGEKGQSSHFGRVAVDGGIPYSVSVSPMMTTVGKLLSPVRVDVDSAVFVGDTVYLYEGEEIVSPAHLLGGLLESGVP
ncbi:MAG: hypothetical protein AAGI52_15770 [Bacteroidota bacterium]